MNPYFSTSFCQLGRGSMLSRRTVPPPSEGRRKEKGKRKKEVEGRRAGPLPFSFCLFTFSFRSAAAPAADPAADGTEPAAGDAGHRGRAAGGRVGPAAGVDEDQDAAAGAGAAVAADPAGGLLLGPLLEVLLRPHEVAGRQDPGAEQDQGELTSHSGHGNPHSGQPTAGRFGTRFPAGVVGVFVPTVFNLYHARGGLTRENRLWGGQKSTTPVPPQPHTDPTPGSGQGFAATPGLFVGWDESSKSD